MTKYLPYSFKKLNYFLSTISILSLLVCIYGLPALANPVRKAYVGKDSDVAVSCYGLKGGNAEGSYSIDGRKSGTRVTSVFGFSIFNHDVKTLKPVDQRTENIANGIVNGDLIFSSREPISYFKANYSNKRATRFGTSFYATGYDGSGNAVISLPIPESDEKFKYEINCPSVR
jgi:hypothetical protein